MKTKTINLYETGGPDNMIWEDVNLPEPSKGEVLLKHEFVGFNMIDTYHRSGIYSTPNKPCGLGTEASGIIEKIGDGNTDEGYNVGDRVAYAGSGNGLGAYSYRRIIKSK